MGFWHLSDSILVEYADGDIEPRQQAFAAGHLARCRKCTRRLERILDAARTCQNIAIVLPPAELRHLSAASLRASGGVEIPCDRAAPLLQESVDGSLSPFAAVVLQQHLNACASCRTELTALASAARAVRTLPFVDSPGEVRARVRAASRHATRPIWGPTAWRPVLAAAAAALVIGAFSLLHPTSPLRPDWQPAAALDVSETTNADTPTVELADLRASERLRSQPPEVREPEETLAAIPESVATAPPVAPAPRPTVRLVSTSPKGPSPAPVTLAVSEPKVVMPTAFAALRAVKAASDEAGVHRALELAGERFATLRSEEVSEAALVKLPAVFEDRPDGTGASLSPGQPDPHESMGRPTQPEGGLVAPAEESPREGASLFSGPFV